MYDYSGLILANINIFYGYEEKEMIKKLEFPDRVTIELTNRCNVSCTFCHRQEIDMELGDMPMDLYKKIIDEMAEHLPIKLVPFFRGESLLHPNFIECIQYAKDRGIGPLQMASNALILNEEMAEKIIEAGLDFISFSLDTIDETIYRQTRIKGNLNISMRNVKNFALKCKEYKKKGKKVPSIQVSSVDMKEYRDRKEEFIAYWKKYADFVRVYYEHDERGKFVNSEVHRSLLEIGERRPCKKVYTDIIIYWNGKIALCNYDWDERKQIGDLYTQSIEEIWSSKEYEDIRKMHESNLYEDWILCKECEHWRAGYIDKGLGETYSGEKAGED